MPISLRAARVNADLTQDEALTELNRRMKSRVAKSTLVSWEQYKTFPQALQFKTLCNIYGVKMDDISIPDTLTLK